MTRPPDTRRRRTRAPQAERGMVHGLSLVLFTLLIFGALGALTLIDRPVHCPCADKSVQEGKASPVDQIAKTCKPLCAAHGGYAPVTKSAR
jgi:hypothetical protein